MKIFILAFCICQIFLAQSNAIKIKPPVQGPAVHLNEAFKAALVATQILAVQVNFFIDKNGQLPEVVSGPAFRYFQFLREKLSKLKEFPRYVGVLKDLENFLIEVKSISGGLKTAGITFETIAAFVTHNIICDVMYIFNKLAKIDNTNVISTDYPKASFPANFKVHNISNEMPPLKEDYKKFSRAYNAIFKHRNLLLRIFRYYEQSVLSCMNLFAVNTVDILAKLVDPEASKMIINSARTLKTQLAGVVTPFVGKGPPHFIELCDIFLMGLTSILNSYEQLVEAAQPLLNESK